MAHPSSASPGEQYPRPIGKGDLDVLRTPEQHAIWRAVTAQHPHLRPVLAAIAQRRPWPPTERELRAWRVLFSEHPLERLLHWIRSAPPHAMLDWCWTHEAEVERQPKREVGTLESITDILARIAATLEERT